MFLPITATSWAQTSTSSGDIVVNGELLGGSCDVVTPATHLVLPKVDAGQLQASGAVAGEKWFSLKLSGCVQMQGLHIYFDRSSPLVSADGRLLNMVANGATQVELEVLNARGETVDLTRESGFSQNTGPLTPLVGGAADIPFSVRYRATGTATAGVVKSTINYIVEYE